MSDAGLIVPTLGNRMDSLIPLLRDCGMPAFVVWTGPIPTRFSREGPPGREVKIAWWLQDESGHSDITVKIDHGPINIHRWWNHGFVMMDSRRLDVGVVVNDDVRAGPGALQKLADHVTGDVALAYLDDGAHAAVRCTPITGYCFASRVRPHLPTDIGCEDDTCHHWNPHLRWWWGEHDLELRVRRAGAGIVAVPGLDIEHLRVGYRYDRQDEISPLIAKDREVFNARWADEVGPQ